MQVGDLVKTRYLPEGHNIGIITRVYENNEGLDRITVNFGSFIHSWHPICFEKLGS